MDGNMGIKKQYDPWYCRSNPGIGFVAVLPLPAIKRVCPFSMVNNGHQESLYLLMAITGHQEVQNTLDDQ
jgi:hypothetical protein